MLELKDNIDWPRDPVSLRSRSTWRMKLQNLGDFDDAASSFADTVFRRRMPSSFPKKGCEITKWCAHFAQSTHTWYTRNEVSIIPFRDTIVIQRSRIICRTCCERPVAGALGGGGADGWRLARWLVCFVWCISGIFVVRAKKKCSP